MTTKEKSIEERLQELEQAKKPQRPVIKLPVMKLKNLQTGFIWEVSDPDQIGKMLQQTFTSHVPTVKYVDGKKVETTIKRQKPRFKVIECDPELKDLIPDEEETLSLRKKLIGEKAVNNLETMDDLKKFALDKGITFSPSIGYEKLRIRIEEWKRANNE
jgi:hypothetical protein